VGCSFTCITERIRRVRTQLQPAIPFFRASTPVCRVPRKGPGTTRPACQASGVGWGRNQQQYHREGRRTSGSTEDCPATRSSLQPHPSQGIPTATASPIPTAQDPLPAAAALSPQPAACGDNRSTEKPFHQASNRCGRPSTPHCVMYPRRRLPSTRHIRSIRVLRNPVGVYRWPSSAYSVFSYRR